MGEWLKPVLAKGVSVLLLLRLKNSPPQDAIQPTLEAWYQVLTYKKRWEEADKPRFEEAFMRLAQTCEQFPTPKQLLEAMPKKPEPPMLEVKLTEEQRAKAAKRLKQLREWLGGAKCTPKQENK